MASKPSCGRIGTVSGAPTLFATITLIWSFVQSVGGGIGMLVGAIKGIDATVLGSATGILGTAVTPWGAVALGAIILTAITAAALIIIWVWQSHNGLCGAPTLGTQQCVTGVVDSVTAGFGFWYSQIAGCQNNQPRIDVVVKSLYWPIIIMGNPAMVWCAACTNCPTSVASSAQIADPAAPCSPVMPCYYHDKQVCAASLGSAVGATVGAALGAIGGTIIAIAAFGAAGCSFTAVFSWICLLVLLLVILIVIAAVAISAAIGSAIGTQAGKATAGGNASPMSGSVVITPGAYVTVQGNMVQSTHSLGANVLWFAGWFPNLNGQTVDDMTTTTSNGTTLFGASTGTRPFCFTDPDKAISASADICPVPSP